MKPSKIASQSGSRTPRSAKEEPHLNLPYLILIQAEKDTTTFHHDNEYIKEVSALVELKRRIFHAIAHSLENSDTSMCRNFLVCVSLLFLHSMLLIRLKLLQKSYSTRVNKFSMLTAL